MAVRKGDALATVTALTAKRMKIISLFVVFMRVVEPDTCEEKGGRGGGLPVVAAVTVQGGAVFKDPKTMKIALLHPQCIWFPDLVPPF